jgi:WD40 repeat protein
VLRALVGVFAVAAVVAVGLSLYAFQQRGQARANEQRALAGEELAQTNANTAATAQANAERSAAEVQTLALSQGAQAAYNQGNIDLARQLALVAAQRPNADAFAEQTLASAVYNPGTQKVLSGHPDVVNSVVYSPDETMAFSGGRNDKTGILWDLKTGTLIKRFTGHDGRIRRVAFLPDGKRVLTGSEDGTIRLWDIACATPSAQECNTPVRVFAAGNGGHTLEVNDAAFTSDGARMLSSSEDTTLVLWDVESGTPIRRMQHPNNAETRGVVILPGDQQALSTGANPDIIRWDLNSGQPIDRLRGHRGTVYSVAVSADGTRVLSSGDDNTVIEWDLQRGAPITFLRGHGGYIRQAVFSADGTHALSASADKTVRVWDLDNGAEQLRLTSADQVNTISLSADTKVLATGSDDGVARLWDLASGKPTGSYNWHERDVKSVALSPDGKYLLTGGGKRDGALILTNLQTGAIERKFGFTVFGTNSIAFTPDGTRAVTGQIIPGGDDYADDPTIDPELKNISLIVWDVASGAPIYKLTDVIAAGDRHDSINTVLITPDGTQIIGATGAGAQILIWDLETGKQLRTLDLNKGGKANDIALSADGKFLVAGSTDKTFMIWEVASGKVVFNSPPQAAAVTTVALNGDGTSVAVASETEVAIWDLRSGQKVRSFLGHRREIRRLLFTAGGHELVSASADGTTRVWRVETLPEIIAWSKEHRFFPGLTCEQLQRYNLDQQGCVSESAPTP